MLAVQLCELPSTMDAGERDAVGTRWMAHSPKSNGADFGATVFAELCQERRLVCRTLESL